MEIIRDPQVYLVGRQTLNTAGIDRFLSEHELTWETDTEIGAETLAEMAGRICYMSFGKGRKTNAEYLGHILAMRHGSVLEHTVWNFAITGVSRSFTHELVRHRAGFGFSQLSQRYVDESTADFVEPDCIADDDELHNMWEQCIRHAHLVYCRLVEGLNQKFAHIEDTTQRRKLARQAARSVLPNATETKIFVTANGRAWRHFIEARANEYAEVEIRKVAIRILRTLKKESPALFSDYQIERLEDGSEVAKTPNQKV
ncbi:MAG: FAD-dependent thymidylate synthase [Phycisphaerae bacterium]|nr:FAD-dependent thymidylate synthase [Phycisphaerae bacterium]